MAVGELPQPDVARDRIRGQIRRVVFGVQFLEHVSGTAGRHALQQTLAPVAEKCRDGFHFLRLHRLIGMEARSARGG